MPWVFILITLASTASVQKPPASVPGFCGSSQKSCKGVPCIEGYVCVIHFGENYKGPMCVKAGPKTCVNTVCDPDQTCVHIEVVCVPGVTEPCYPRASCIYGNPDDVEGLGPIINDPCAAIDCFPPGICKLLDGKPSCQTTIEPLVLPQFCDLSCDKGKHCQLKYNEPSCVPDNCGKHEVYNQCGNHCEQTCEYGTSPRPCILLCGPAACVCDKDYYRNDVGVCVKLDDCNAVNPCAFTTCLAPSDCIVVEGQAKCVAPGTGGGSPYAV